MDAILAAPLGWGLCGLCCGYFLWEHVCPRAEEVFPAWMPAKNPLDSWPSFEIHGIDKSLRHIIPILFESGEIDMVLLMIAAMQVATTFDPKIISEMQELGPLVTYFIGESSLKNKWTSYIRSHNGIVVRDIQSAINVLHILSSYGMRKKSEIKN